MSKTQKKRVHRPRNLAPWSYPLQDVLQIVTGAKRTQVEFWVREHVIVPQLRSAGTGNQRRFDFRNLVQIDVAVTLSSKGFPLREITAALFALEESDGGDGRMRGPAIQADIQERRRAKGLDPIYLRSVRGELRHAAEVIAADPSFAGQFEEAMAVGRANDAKNATEYFESILAGELDAWRAFKNPEKRSHSVPHFLVQRDIDGIGLLWQVQAAAQALRVESADRSVFLLNLAAVLGRIEAASGDRWRTWDELAAVDERLKVETL